MFLQSRVGILRRISEVSKPVLDHINEVLGPELSMEIDKKFIKKFAKWFDSEEQAIEMVSEHFPNVSVEDVITIYKSARE